MGREKGRGQRGVDTHTRTHNNTHTYAGYLAEAALAQHHEEVEVAELDAVSVAVRVKL